MNSPIDLEVEMVDLNEDEKAIFTAFAEVLLRRCNTGTLNRIIDPRFIDMVNLTLHTNRSFVEYAIKVKAGRFQ